MIRAADAPMPLRVIALAPGLAEPPIERILRWFEQLGAPRTEAEPQALAPPLTAAERTRLSGPPEAVPPLFDRAEGRTPILFLGPRDCRPHCWALRSGTRYALVPADAVATIVAHELGHLLFHWPDLSFGRHEQVRCLMSRIAPEASMESLIPPCTPLRVAAGWMKAANLDPRVPAPDVPEARAFAWAGYLIERQARRLAIFRLRERSNGPDVTLHRSVAIGDASQTALALASRAVGPTGAKSLL